MSYSSRFTFLLGIQTFLLLMDVVFNSASEFSRTKRELQLVLFVFQDVAIVISLTVTLVSLFSTYIFQAGLVEVLLVRFRLPIIISLAYLLVTIGLHVWLLTDRWDNPYLFHWSNWLLVYFSFQKMVAPIYYYSTKRAMLRVSDPRYYQNPDWINHQIIKAVSSPPQ